MALTESARNFLRTVTPPKSDIVNDALEKQRTVRRSEERRRAEEKSRRLAPAVVRIRNSDDSPTAYLLRQALTISKNESFSKALEFISKARDLNPEYWEVDRVEAFLLSAQGYVDQSIAVYNNALGKARSDDDSEGIAVVSFFLAGHLSRSANLPEDALPYAKAAQDHFDISETAQLLGTILSWLGQFEDAQMYLEKALDTAEGRTRLITLTTLIDSWKRWGESLLTQEHRPVDSAQKAYAGFAIGWNEIKSGTFDRKLAESVIESASLMLRVMRIKGIEHGTLQRSIDGAIKAIYSRRAMFSECRSYPYFRRNLASYSRVRDIPAEGKMILSDDLRDESNVAVAPEDVDTSDLDLGEVISWRGTYGFIKHSDFPRNVFFPASVVENIPNMSESRDLTGRPVKFKVQDKSAERVRADWVELL